MKDSNLCRQNHKVIDVAIPDNKMTRWSMEGYHQLCVLPVGGAGAGEIFRRRSECCKRRDQFWLTHKNFTSHGRTITVFKTCLRLFGHGVTHGIKKHGDQHHYTDARIEDQI